MPSLGVQYLLEFRGCDPVILDDAPGLFRIIVHEAMALDVEPAGDHFHRFSPQGLSGAVGLEGHLIAVHTWPEHRYATIDIFTSQGSLDAETVRQSLATGLGAAESTCRTLKRGTTANIELRRASDHLPV